MCKRSCRHRSAYPRETRDAGGSARADLSRGEGRGAGTRARRREEVLPWPLPGKGQTGSPEPSGCVPVPLGAHICKKTEGPERLGWLGLPASLQPLPVPRDPGGGGCTPATPHPRPGQHTLGRQGYLLPAPPRTPGRGRSGALLGAGLLRGGALSGAGLCQGRALTGAGFCRAGLCQGRGFGGGWALAGGCLGVP